MAGGSFQWTAERLFMSKCWNNYISPMRCISASAGEFFYALLDGIGCIVSKTLSDILLKAFSCVLLDINYPVLLDGWILLCIAGTIVPSIAREMDPVVYCCNNLDAKKDTIIIWDAIQGNNYCYTGVDNGAIVSLTHNYLDCCNTPQHSRCCC